MNPGVIRASLTMVSTASSVMLQKATFISPSNDDKSRWQRYRRQKLHNPSLAYAQFHILATSTEAQNIRRHSPVQPPFIAFIMPSLNVSNISFIYHVVQSRRLIKKFEIFRTGTGWVSKTWVREIGAALHERGYKCGQQVRSTNGSRTPADSLVRGAATAVPAVSAPQKLFCSSWK